MNRATDSDKRKYIRYEFLEYALLTAPSFIEAQHVVIVNIGLGGLQLRARSKFVAGEKCSLQVGKEDCPPISLPGEIRHVISIEGSDLYAIGVRFLPKTHEERLTIAEFVHAVFQRQCNLLTM